jgi:hypothetical protein
MCDRAVQPTYSLDENLPPNPAIVTVTPIVGYGRMPTIATASLSSSESTEITRPTPSSPPARPRGPPNTGTLTRAAVAQASLLRATPSDLTNTAARTMIASKSGRTLSAALQTAPASSTNDSSAPLSPTRSGRVYDSVPTEPSTSPTQSTRSEASSPPVPHRKNSDAKPPANASAAVRPPPRLDLVCDRWCWCVALLIWLPHPMHKHTQTCRTSAYRVDAPAAAERERLACGA